ncbi:heavy-metal-associated domain-containing protein [Ammoniphilus resinae]|uniref:Copper chaperone CopZ n=1 Tax=Ammoniphilus resinae TaxID=861532 RepID=A0ABS4GWU8_9BACL|nr:heavy-metal-associated domain-containing protein [Ammoniphilus resinae]MBP1934745.1 copper chaperone CopZ [Ammoniphilus resinae]
MKTKTIRIKGIKDQKEAQQVVSGMKEVWGVREADINLATGEVTVSFDDQAASVQDIEQAILDYGLELEGKS